ncbi:helix-turn-helix domain-containing protein [Streptosporangium roseum]|uniref:helix-turn-helix domain-containing protein n=1 Tax=Streptosporangium roseum TaxID=2001 RepID=UPI003316BA54
MQAVRERIERFNAEGLNGLGDRPGAGSKPRITEVERGRIIALARSTPPGCLAREETGDLAATESGPPQWTLNSLTAATARAAGILIARSQVAIRSMAFQLIDSSSSFPWQIFAWTPSKSKTTGQSANQSPSSTKRTIAKPVRLPTRCAPACRRSSTNTSTSRAATPSPAPTWPPGCVPSTTCLRSLVKPAVSDRWSAAAQRGWLAGGGTCDEPSSSHAGLLRRSMDVARAGRR